MLYSTWPLDVHRHVWLAAIQLQARFIPQWGRVTHIRESTKESQISSSINTLFFDMAEAATAPPDDIITVANKKSSTNNAKLLAGRVQTCFARSSQVVDLQHGQRARGARQAGVGSGGNWREVRGFRGGEGAARVLAGGMQNGIARTHKVVDLQDAGGLEVCSGGVVAALMARVAELEASAAADREALVVVQRAFDLQSHMLHTAIETAKRANAALQSSASLLCRKDAQIEALQQGIHNIALTSIQLAQQQQQLLGVWQQRCDTLFLWGTEWAVFSGHLLGGGCADGRGLRMGLAAESGCSAGVESWVGREWEGEVELAVGGIVAEVCSEVVGGCGGGGVEKLDCSVEDEGEGWGSVPMPFITLPVGDSVSFPPSSLLTLVVSRPAPSMPRVSLFFSPRARLLFSPWPGCPFSAALLSSLPVLVGAFVFALRWVARRDALGLSGLRRGRCMAARTELTLFVIVAFALCF